MEAQAAQSLVKYSTSTGYLMTRIFVFGSNLAGRHGKGAALHARRNHGAIYGQGIGRQGNSYGIPTKDENLRVIGLPEISLYVNDFLEYARDNPELKFQITAIGTGLAGYPPSRIAWMFRDAPGNCELPTEFTEILEKP